MSSTGADGPFVEQQRLERAINWARWSGAVLVFLLGPFFANLGPGFILVLGLYLVAYGFFTRALSERARTRVEHRRVALISLILDGVAVTLAALTFSPDPEWSTYFYMVLVVITGAFRFGGRGAVATASGLSLAFVAIDVWRGAQFGYPVEAHRIASNVSVFLLSAFLMSGILRELYALRAQQERLLREASEAEVLREADRLKSEFLATVSHEFRSPLTVLRGALELLLGEHPGPLARAQRELLDSAGRNVKRLQGFTEELLEMAQLEERRVTIETEEIDPAALVAEVAADHRVVAEQREQRIVVDAARAPPIVTADPRRLRQIVGNLVMNALRYAPRGSTIDLLAGGEDGLLRIRVRDRGPGVPQEERARIFEKFIRGRSADGVPGSGLGLAIARSLAELHGGQIAYEDTPGGGSTFVVSIPLEKENP